MFELCRISTIYYFIVTSYVISEIPHIVSFSYRSIAVLWIQQLRPRHTGRHDEPTMSGPATYDTSHCRLVIFTSHNVNEDWSHRRRSIRDFTVLAFAKYEWLNNNHSFSTWDSLFPVMPVVSSRLCYAQFTSPDPTRQNSFVGVNWRIGRRVGPY